jgi:ABC-type transporter Mla subunit MlaD
MSRDKPRKEPSKAALTIRGAIGAAVVVALVAYTTVAATGALTGYPEITSTVPATGAGINEQAPVEHKGVVVGKVIKTETEETTSTVTMRIYDRQAEGISAHSTVRVLPRTLFGDQFVQLAPPEGDHGRGISDGDVLQPDTSDETIQLYEAYVRLTDLLREIEP